MGSHKSTPSPPPLPAGEKEKTQPKHKLMESDWVKTETKKEFFCDKDGLSEEK